MQKYSATSLFTRAKYALLDEIRINFRSYLSYFIILAIGLIVGIVWGIKIGSSDTECNVINYLDGFLCGESGVFTLFFDYLVTYILFGVLIFFALKTPFLVWVTMIGASLFLAKGVRDGLFLILSCGGSAIVTGVLFYMVFRLIYCIVLSFSIVFIILHKKYLPCNCANQVVKVLVLYGLAVLTCFIYSFIISIISSIILV